MKKHEIIKYAYENYPKGTKFYSSFSGNECVSDGSFNFFTAAPNCLITMGNDVFTNGTWATVVTEETRKPLTKSEDGVELFEGDSYHRAYRKSGESKWIYNDFWQGLESDCYGIVETQNEFKLFSTKQAALDWIDEQNKPKEIEVKLHGYERKAIIKSNIILIYKGVSITETLKYSDIEDIAHALKQLNNG